MGIFSASYIGAMFFLYCRFFENVTLCGGFVLPYPISFSNQFNVAVALIT
ncbi:hypothetical protein NRI_0783 [Neorickettsia risticii str. Illinois]|uniref:Uncharacterized protein n=1 Tax=Neorickettsia risticii (strain Illinois) TaxID=434131 RepID=C6V5T7_NEORI|nr:hypothetical protein NRI_0783 [Neorickettsia risticii str. Illinois]